MSERSCWNCKYHRLEGDTYHTVERCKLSGVTQKHALDFLKVCEHYKPKSKGILGFWKEVLG